MLNKVHTYKVIRDTREKVGHGWMFKKEGDCLGTEIKKLDSGDYSIEGWEKDFVIERKRNTGELATNIYEKRFEEELCRLDEYKYPFIICEFSFNDVVMFPINSGIPKQLFHKVKMSADFMQNSLAKWQVKHKVKIIFAGACGDLAATKLFKYVAKYG